MKTLLLIILTFTSICAIGQTSILQREVSSIADNDSTPTRVSKGKDTLYLLNNPMGNMLKQVWVDPTVNKSVPKVVPVIIIVDSFDVIDKKKLALRPSQIQQ